MPSPSEYQQQIRDLGLEELTVRVSNKDEANEALARFRGLQRELRLMKRGINLDMKAIRASFRDQISSAGAGTSLLFDLFGQRKVGGSIRASAKRDVRRQQDAELEPYENLKLSIDDLLHQLETAKVRLQGYKEDA